MKYIGGTGGFSSDLLVAYLHSRLAVGQVNSLANTELSTCIILRHAKSGEEYLHVMVSWGRNWITHEEQTADNHNPKIYNLLEALVGMLISVRVKISFILEQ